MSFNLFVFQTDLKQRGSLSIWFDPEMDWTPPPSDQRGRQQQFSDAAIQARLTLKVLFGMPLRQTAGFDQRLLSKTANETDVEKWIAASQHVACA